MENKLRTRTDSNSVDGVPAFGVTPSPRCFSTTDPAGRRKCGELATRRRRGNAWFTDTFHCDRHALETDIRLDGEFVIRRVRVTLDVLLAGVDESAPIAQGEAVDRLEAAIVAAGGLTDISKVTSTIGRYPAHAGRNEAAKRLGRPE